MNFLNDVIGVEIYCADINLNDFRPKESCVHPGRIIFIKV